jgi:hypothetical protein
MKVAGRLFGKRKGASRSGEGRQQRVVGVKIIKVHYMHV